MAGAKIGQVFDERVLHNYQCMDCDHQFSAHHSLPLAS
jgi:hypothetical protein